MNTTSSVVRKFVALRTVLYFTALFSTPLFSTPLHGAYFWSTTHDFYQFCPVAR